jgi:hypothetical protein
MVWAADKRWRARCNAQADAFPSTNLPGRLKFAIAIRVLPDASFRRNYLRCARIAK